MSDEETWKGITLDERAKLILSVNLKGLNKSYVRPFSPFEVARCLKILIDNGVTKEEIRIMLNLRDKTMIGKYLSILDLEDDLRAMIDWGRRPGSVAVTNCFEGGLVRIKPKEDRRMAFEYAMKYNLNKLECQMIRQLHNRKFGTIQKCAEEALKTRAKIVHNHLYLGQIENLEVNKKLSELEGSKRKKLFSDILEKIFPGIRILGFNLNIKAFSIVLSEKGNQKMIEKFSGDIEKKISDELKVRL